MIDMNKCKICDCEIVSGDEPKGWVCGERIFIQHIDKKIDFCLTCLTQIREQDERFLKPIIMK